MDYDTQSVDYDIQLVDKEDIKIGDTILCKDGNLRTVCVNNISYGFMGLCLFGDSYRLGQERVNKVILS